MSEIKQLEQLLKPVVEPDWYFVDYTCERLTLKGENYGSLILSLEVKFKNSENEERLAPLVAKMIPENPWLREMFRIQDTFVKEMNFYGKVIPTLIKFQLKEGMENTMNFFPKYFGGRINLKPDSKVVDEDGVILLENLEADGYVIGDRTVGFNKETTEVILKYLAVFHAVPIALKMKRPNVFEKRIKANIKFVKTFDLKTEDTFGKMITQYEIFAREDPKTAHLTGSIRDAGYSWQENRGKLRDGPFATITHNDFWVNNIMLKFDENAKPLSCKMFDFKTVNYESLARDIIFFLFTSVQSTVVEEYYESFLKLYYDEFIEILRCLHCDTTEYTFEALEKELGASAKHTEFFHCLKMIKPLVALPSDIADLEDFSLDEIMKYKSNPREKLKVQFIVREFSKRNWI